MRAILGLHKHFRGQILKSFQFNSAEYLPQSGNISFFIPLKIRDVIALSPSESQELFLLSEDDMNLSWNSASGGEKQKALLSRALRSSSTVLIFDEPLNHLDQNARALFSSLLNSQVQLGKAILVISHEAVLEGLRVSQRLHIGDPID